MPVHRRVIPSIKFAGTHLYTWVERGTVRAKCLAQEHNTMSPARARTRTARSGDERTNHEATAPPTTMRWYTYVKVDKQRNKQAMAQHNFESEDNWSLKVESKTTTTLFDFPDSWRWHAKMVQGVGIEIWRSLVQIFQPNFIWICSR